MKSNVDHNAGFFQYAAKVMKLFCAPAIAENLSRADKYDLMSGFCMEWEPADCAAKINQRYSRRLARQLKKGN